MTGKYRLSHFAHFVSELQKTLPVVLYSIISWKTNFRMLEYEEFVSL